MLVIAGSASPDLAQSVSERLNCGLVKPELTKFPDGELHLKIPVDLEGEHVVIVQSTPYPQNDNFMELLLLLDTVEDLGAKEVAAIVPYFAYARQDKRFEPGEAVTMQTMLKLIESTEPDRLLTVDVHEEKSIKGTKIPAKNLHAMPLVGKWLFSLNLKNPLLLGPDRGAQDYAEQAAGSLGADYDYLFKKRKSPTEVSMEPKSLDVEGRDVVILDDIISTGGTVIEALELLKKHNARKIYAGCTHAVLAGNALDRILEAGAEGVFATDTIETEISKMSVAPIIADTIAE
ncbi:hypothetical protein AKJ45_00100 [candidate division MSBL1 archaeon SCGC-AAA261F19]|uniref:Ribose-phosphate pyrophosphokinase n=2 Tax=candidate division MSBL1 TaxID=215777 RepID=A0A133VBS6_9EURY|nr:hypothetical protein AKJ43_01985 [candidate division MSBL1 archaeon SCGC-AAA261D19]KXB03906.1 hypothetical protein AKJ45_00100 [candidate division MSBL1 archaeon SCGC-AAA261F19]